MPANMAFDVILHGKVKVKIIYYPEKPYHVWKLRIDVMLTYDNRRETLTPSRTSSYASVLRSIQFRVSPFIDKVSENDKEEKNEPLSRSKEVL